VVTDLLSGSYQYLKKFSFIDRNAQKSGNRERSSGSRNQGYSRIEPDTQQARETAHTEGKTAHQDREHMAEIGRKGGKTASHKRTPVASKPTRKMENQNRAHMAEIGRKGGEKVSQDHEHMAEIGHKGGEKVSQDHEHMAEIGRKGHKTTGSERRDQSRTKGSNV
jgi:hypothetical protein